MFALRQIYTCQEGVYVNIYIAAFCADVEVNEYDPFYFILLIRCWMRDRETAFRIMEAINDELNLGIVGT